MLETIKRVTAAVAERSADRVQFKTIIAALVAHLQSGYAGQLAAMIPTDVAVAPGSTEAWWQEMYVSSVLRVAERHGFSVEAIEAALATVLGSTKSVPVATYSALRNGAVAVTGTADEVATFLASCEVLGASFKVFGDGFIGFAKITASGTTWNPQVADHAFQAAMGRAMGR